MLKKLNNYFKKKFNNLTKILTICKIIKAMDINKATTIVTMGTMEGIAITKTIVAIPEVTNVGIMDTKMPEVIKITGMGMI